MAIPEGITAMERRKATCPQRKGITAWVIFIRAGGGVVMVPGWWPGR
jgi:hypothetical protein